MVRRVRVDGQPVTRSAAAFGFSRPSFYQAAAAVEAGGLHAEVVRDDERDATIVTGTAPSSCVPERSRSAVTHGVTIRDGSVTR
jgi:hypothetical protein